MRKIPCPHFNIQIIGRSKEHRSAVASAAYQSGDRLYSEQDREWKRYPDRDERVLHTEVLLPSHVPRAYADRQTLWNAVEKEEKHARAVFARRFVITLPRELSDEDNLRLIRQYCQEQFVNAGMIVDLAFHHDGNGNPHAHVLTTCRPIDEQGRWCAKSHYEPIIGPDGKQERYASGHLKSKKVFTVDWDDPGNCEKWRHEWEVLQNRYLEQAGCPERVDMRSYERQRIELVPTIHLGPEASAMERQGKRTFLGDINRAIRQHNAKLLRIKKAIKSLTKWTDQLKAGLAAQSEKNRQPTLSDLLGRYVSLRMDERFDWRGSGVAKVKQGAKDLVLADKLRAYLKEHDLTEVPDLLERLGILEAKASAAGEIIQKNNARRKTIAKIEQTAQRRIELLPVFEEYQKKFFKAAKEKFAAEHEDELKESKRCYAFLMKHHHGELTVQPHEFDEELAKMADADAAANAELDEIREDLETLRTIRRCIGKVNPDIIGEKRSVSDDIARAQTEIRLKDEAKRNEEKERGKNRG